MTYTQFVYKYNEKFAEYNHDGYENQCMDLFFFYLKEVVGIDPKPYQGWGNPKNVWNNTSKIKDFDKNFIKIPNGPKDIPQKGDIMFYGTYLGVTGISGHVDIFDHGDLYTTVCFTQNYPTGSKCHFYQHGRNKILHGYRGVLGWFRPKK